MLYKVNRRIKVLGYAFFDKFTDMGTYMGICPVDILVRVPEKVTTSVKLLRICKVPEPGTLLEFSQYMGTLNSVLSLG